MTGLIILAVIAGIGYRAWLRLAPLLLRRRAEQVAAQRGLTAIPTTKIR